MNKGQKLLKKAKKIIPGGNQLLSKRAEIFAPNIWPTYYTRAKGCEIWDLDKKKYYDFAGMGVTACLLGYADNYVNKKVKNAIDRASLTTLNSKDEIKLAQTLIQIHKWAKMVKFCKSGGEACLVAIRLARSISKKQNIAFCGYHGWHDWYLSANLKNNKNLDNQLLPGLKTLGVNKSYTNSMFPFFYNDIDSLKKILIKKNDVGIIIMEPMRFIKPKKNFLKEVKSLARKNGIILIFDEITSGFHDNFGGIHLKFGVNPDLAIFGKALGNGFPISAIIGKKKIMQKANETFISSTMWTEQIGFVAANATLEKLKKDNVNIKNIKIGRKIKEIWRTVAVKNNLNIIIGGIDTLPSFKFNYSNQEVISTFMTREMLKYRILANTAPAVTLAYKSNILKIYEKAINKVFKKISQYLNNNKKIPLNKKDIKLSNFGRLTG
ncbi:aminotransferase class III-fold pyridoxal phosphate-dependent enzyme [Candidatus Pelagibacter sp.]|nr:aminotransferase class III-fold pyridoxal phosphate-dependent enzyme [Candidatus Pelagibacter sp.]